MEQENVRLYKIVNIVAKNRRQRFLRMLITEIHIQFAKS